MLNATEAGVTSGLQMQRVIADQIPKVVAVLEQRGLRPIEVVEQSIKDDLDDLDMLVEDHWYRHISKLVSPWWQGPPLVDHFFFAGLLSVPGFSSKQERPPRSYLIRSGAGQICAFPWKVYVVRRYLRRRRDDLCRPLHGLRNLLPIWAPMKLGLSASEKTSFRIRGLEFRTVWIARNLELMLGWHRFGTLR